ncbi:MAG: hypothetical protein AMXMBFR74_20650 [Parvibaculum sp.]
MKAFLRKHLRGGMTDAGGHARDDDGFHFFCPLFSIHPPLGEGRNLQRVSGANFGAGVKRLRSPPPREILRKLEFLDPPPGAGGNGGK